jgi:copper chaperone CopZ
METQRESGPIVRLDIDDMSCGHCVQAVRDALGRVDGLGVRDVQVGWAVIQPASPALVDEAINAIERAGYSARRGRPEGGPAKPGCSCCTPR